MYQWRVHFIWLMSLTSFWWRATSTGLWKGNWTKIELPHPFHNVAYGFWFQYYRNEEQYFSRAHAHAHTHAHAHIYWYIYICICIRIRMRMHTYTHRHTHTHKYTHTYSINDIYIYTYYSFTMETTHHILPQRLENARNHVISNLHGCNPWYSSRSRCNKAI